MAERDDLTADEREARSIARAILALEDEQDLGEREWKLSEAVAAIPPPLVPRVIELLRARGETQRKP